MDYQLINELELSNPWLTDPSTPIITEADYLPRTILPELLNSEWDNYWTLLVGPRRAGKTTLGRLLSQRLINESRFQTVLYLNCDFDNVRQGLKSPAFVKTCMDYFKLTSPIVFIDEVQRLQNPGLLLKAVIDVNLPIKHIATGSSQLEMRSKVQEHLTGRQLTTTVLPLSIEEYPKDINLDELLRYGTYPQVITSHHQERVLSEIYDRYIKKDIIEILKLGQPDILKQLLTLVAHQSGQLVNYNQLAQDCKISVTTIRNHLDVLEQTFVLEKIKPFVGNKRSEVVSNPIYYFIDNGFRNMALRNFSPVKQRTDIGLLVESFIFQELLKFKTRLSSSFDIHYWRTKSGAEVDFVLYRNDDNIIPIEVKYRNLNQPTISRGYRSFLEAYQPKRAFVITKTFFGETNISQSKVTFIPLPDLRKLFTELNEWLD